MEFTPQKGRYSFRLHCEMVIFRDNCLRQHYRGMTVMGEVDLKGKGFNDQLADSKGTRETNSNNYTTNFYHFIRTCSQGFEGNEFFFFYFSNGHAGAGSCIYLYGQIDQTVDSHLISFYR